MNTEQLPQWLRQQAEGIVKRGKDVQQEISKLAAGAADGFHRTKDGLTGLARAVLEGAAEGARQSAQPGSVLREVVAGLADGLANSAQALKLTLEEAKSGGRAYADEDLKKAAGDFRDVGEQFNSAVKASLKGLGGELSGQLHNLSEHASRALDSAKPKFESAVRAAAEHPLQAGKEAVQAGAGAARQAAGVLFSELGSRLEKTGRKWRGTA
jgi:hypothetical protein